MSKTYKITLTPLDTFFFGGETTFGSGDGANYFAKSNLFPQQTTLLGMLRYQLLLQNKTNNTAELSKLIGKDSFDASSESKQSFGVIEKISPVSMLHDDKHYFLRSREFVETSKKEVSALTLHSIEGAKTSLNSQTIQNISIFRKEDNSPYNPKEYFTSQLVRGANVRETKKIFKESEKVGITKYKDGRPKDAPDNGLGFYKQTSYKLAAKWSFAFYADLKELYNGNTNVVLNNAIVQLGGENRPFSMQITPDDVFVWAKYADEYQDDASPICANTDKIILLSDAYLPSSIYEDCDFASTDIVDFRNIRADITKVSDYAAMSDDKETMLQKAKEKIHLLKRGSVLFTRNADAIIKLLETSTFRTIGYNYYKIIEKTSK
jgi:CRISPR-associated protein Cmr3